jgi:hypothetical protein
MIGTMADYPSTIRAAVASIAIIARRLYDADDTTRGPVGEVAYPVANSRGTVTVHNLRVVISRRDGIAGPAGTAYIVCDCAAQARGFQMCTAMADTAYVLGGAAVPIGRHLHRAAR